MGIAHTYWSGFLEATAILPRSLFDRTALINPCASDFFRYCTEVTVGAAGATVVPTRLITGSGSPSWLWHQGSGVPHILLDLATIRATFQPKTEQRTIMRIIIHEVGHLVLHYPKIAALARGAVKSCSDPQEQEAWVFVGAIVGLALGQAALDRRPLIKDNAWPLAA